MAIHRQDARASESGANFGTMTRRRIIDVDECKSRVLCSVMCRMPAGNAVNNLAAAAAVVGGSGGGGGGSGGVGGGGGDMW